MNSQNNQKNAVPPSGPPDIATIKARLKRPKKAVVTAGMPYANGPIHLGHLAGALIPPDIQARYLKLLIGKDNVLFISGNDDHGSTSELSALKAGRPLREFIDEIHQTQLQTLKNYHVDFDLFTGTSQKETYQIHRETSQEFLEKLNQNGLLEKKVTKQWFDPTLSRFLQDRFVRGKCPNPQCDNHDAFSDECEACGLKFDPSELLEARSELSSGRPELRDSLHWWIDMSKVRPQLVEWIESKKKTWRGCVYNEVINTVLPSLLFSSAHEAKYKEIKADFPKHKMKYHPGKKILLQFEREEDLKTSWEILTKTGIPPEENLAWAKRSITRDVSWGIPLPQSFGPEAEGKTLYVWPDSLIAPISFSKVALKKRGLPPEAYKDYWCDPEARVFQFLGQDNIYFYVVMQGSMWLGSLDMPAHLPKNNELQLTDAFGCFNLMVDGEKMSKSKGNFYTGDELLKDKNYHPDQIRYYLANMSLPEKTSSFDFSHFEERNKFLAGPLNAAFEKPISACHSKFEGVVPEGDVSEKVLKETTKMIQNYTKFMERVDWPTLLGMIENYARLINSLFAQYKPHDDRHPLEERSQALFECFYILKNLMIMLWPFVPSTMERLSLALNLNEKHFSIDELGKPIPAGHKIGPMQDFFPKTEV